MEHLPDFLIDSLGVIVALHCEVYAPDLGIVGRCVAVSCSGLVPDSEFLYPDFAKGIQLQVLTQSSSRDVAGIENPSEQFDSYIFLREATPMKDRCLPVMELKW